jgi:hypothetical protein
LLTIVVLFCLHELELMFMLTLAVGLLLAIPGSTLVVDRWPWLLTTADVVVFPLFIIVVEQQSELSISDRS